MFKNYLKIAFRKLIRYKTFSIINISGLAIGMACFILIMLWVNYELSYDKFHKNKNEIYRITGKNIVNNKVRQSSIEYPRPLAFAIKEEIPEIASSAIFRTLSNKMIVKYADKAFYETGIAGADPDFFTIFSFPFIKGNPQMALTEPYSIVITESIAQKYFNDKDPINLSIEIDGVLHKITGVIKNIPSNSHIQFDFLTSSHFIEQRVSSGWGDFCMPIYVQLEKGVQTIEVIPKINEVVKTKIPWAVDRYKLECSLQPLTDIHLNSDFIYDYSIIIDNKLVIIFTIIAFFVLFIAIANFINLSTALTTNRAKEIGLRKVVGSNRLQLIKQFIGECILYVFFAHIIAMILVELILPGFNNHFGKNLEFNYMDWKHIAGFVGLIVFTGLLAGSYPAFLISSYNPVNVLKGNLWFGSKKSVLRKILIVAQFVISIGLICCTTIFYKQISFMLNKDLGFDRENLIYFQVKGNIGSNYNSIKNELLQHTNILGVTAANYITTDFPNRTSDIYWDAKDPDITIIVEKPRIDYDFLKTFDLKIISGRNFSKEFSTDATKAFILNEEAVNQIGIQSPIGKRFSLQEQQGTIIGVIKNAHYRSLQYRISPQVYTLLNDFAEHDRAVMIVKIKGSSLKNDRSEIANAIVTIEHIWKKYNPNYPFEYHFLDQSMERLYHAEKRISRIFQWFSILAIIIACLGLFGLASFTVEKRTKEMGIRKVLGASISGIIILLSKEFIKWVLLANFIAWPVVYLFMNKWLQNFAYRIDLAIWPFLLAGFLALLIALLTVSWQAIRAATANPVEALRYE